MRWKQVKIDAKRLFALNIDHLWLPCSQSNANAKWFVYDAIIFTYDDKQMKSNKIICDALLLSVEAIAMYMITNKITTDKLAEQHF